MDAQPVAPLEARNTAIHDAVNVDEANIIPTPDASTSAKSTDPDAKAAERKDAKKAAKDKRNGKKKSKAKKSAKRPQVDVSDKSDSDDDASSDSSSSSSSSSSSDSDSEYVPGKKRHGGNRRHGYKGKKKHRLSDLFAGGTADSNSSSDSDSDSSDSRSIIDDDSDRSETQQEEINRLNQVIQQMQMDRAGFIGDVAIRPGVPPPNNIYPNTFVNSGAPFNPGFAPPPRSFDPRAHGRIILPPQQGMPPRRGRPPVGIDLGGVDPRRRHPSHLPPARAPKDRRRGRSPKPEFKRVDHVWDNTIHAYKLQDTAEATSDAQYDEYIFHVRRSFDWEGKYKHTQVDIKSKLLRECLQEVMGNIKGVSLVEETPKIDPNMLFLYLEDLEKHAKKLKKEMTNRSKSNKRGRKKSQKRDANKRAHLKVLIKYINKDYASIKSSLYPMLENGLITFDLVWALWKPETLAFTSTYGCVDEPRVFKVELAEKHTTLMKGVFYLVEGKYFEYDGKQFGYGTQIDEISEFRGARKITSLPVYPLKYHKTEAQTRKDLIERGKKFVSLAGVNYRAHHGMAFYKKKRSVVKVNINGRIMVDASIHRRINPNYPISLVRPKDHDILSDNEEDDDDGCCAADSDSDDEEQSGGKPRQKIKFVIKAFKDPKGKVQMIRVPKAMAEGHEGQKKLEKLDDDAKEGGGEDEPADKDAKEDKKPPEFSDEEYLIASPVVLGFAFAEKLWLEFTVSGVKDIQWNETAYESLVLEPKTKDIVKALVESHKYHAAESIDDVIQGKGKGLVAVLHGPPGTGKTLTAEGISELLKCPLYMVSAGELGTDSRYLEAELQKILDICHAWGAILLLDEADVFLEKRNIADIHRNALVSIFLRQLEYFQGILFLTTNRVETFDDAFQSRIHIALRYDPLKTAAKKAIFKIFIERVRVMEKADTTPFTEADLSALAQHDLNGRQIKNTVGTAQALAINKGEALSMAHIRQVLDVQMSFDRDLKGGTGYQDAMRSYF